MATADLWALRTLVAVADGGSFTAAAAALATTQPAVSRQVGALERRYGTQLFRRAARGVRPTPAGEVAIEQARQILARVAAMESQLRAFAGPDAGQVRLSAFPSANTALVPRAVRRFAGRYPGVAVSLLDVPSARAAHAVRDGELDLALITGWDTASTAPHDGVELVPLPPDQLWVALPRDDPAASGEEVRLADLRDRTWIEGAHPDCLGPLTALRDALGGPPRTAYHCDDWNGKQALVAAGLGITLYPSVALPCTHPGIVLRRPVPALPTRPLYAALPEPPFRLPATTHFLQTLTTEITGPPP
ncbi:MAG: LysR family transcriptional regulator [Mycobacteriales bacterium]